MNVIISIIMENLNSYSVRQTVFEWKKANVFVVIQSVRTMQNIFLLLFSMRTCTKYVQNTLCLNRVMIFILLLRLLLLLFLLCAQHFAVAQQRSANSYRDFKYIFLFCINIYYTLSAAGTSTLQYYLAIG